MNSAGPLRTKRLCICKETGGGNVHYLLEFCVSGVYEGARTGIFNEAAGREPAANL